MKKWWQDLDWRFIQTNLREIDMADIDADQYVRDLQAFDATIAMINTSGIIASYETKLPYHYQSPYLTGDSLQTIIAKCHEAGIKVFARTDFSKVRRPIYEAHPDWAYRDTQGKIVDYEGDVHVCLNGDYQQKYALEIIRETLTELDVDGIFFNMAGYTTRDYSEINHGICQCKNCSQLFHERTGMKLPTKEDLSDPVYQAYLVFKSITSSEYNRKVCEFIKTLRPDILINHDTYTESSGFIRQESSTQLSRSLPHWPYSGSANTKWVRGTFPEYISSNTTVDFIDYPIRHVAVSPYQQALRLYQNLANGGSLDYYLIGRLDNHEDQSGYAGIKRVFAFHKANQGLYHDLQADCRTVVLTDEHWGGHGSGATDEYFGLYRALTESHQLFDVVFLSQAQTLGLDKYQTILLPNLEEIDDETAALLDSAVASGKTLIATGNSGYRHKGHAERGENALDCLRFAQKLTSQDIRGAYLTIDDRSWTRHLRDTSLVAVDGDYLYATYAPETELWMKLIPPQPYGPPERCYPRQPALDYPGVASASYGSGKAVFLPWYPGRFLYRQGYQNTVDYLTDVFEQMIGMKPICDDIPPAVEATLLHRPGESFRLFHLVNNNGHFSTTFYPPSAIHDITCRLSLDTRQVSSVKSLVSGQALDFKWEAGELTFTVDRLNAFEAILIEG